MSILVPGAGFSGQLTVGPGATGYMALGPIPGGSWIDIVEILVDLIGEAAGQSVLVGIGLLGSESASAAGFAASESLVDRGYSAALGKPGLAFASVQSVVALLRLYPGRLVQIGSAFVIVGVVSAAVGVATGVMVSVRTRRWSSPRGA